MSGKWRNYVGGIGVPGDRVKIREQSFENLKTVELCGQVNKEKWWVTSITTDDTRMIDDSQIKGIYVDVHYYNRRIRLCDKYERINREQREMFEAKKMEFLRKESLRKESEKHGKSK